MTRAHGRISLCVIPHPSELTPVPVVAVSLAPYGAGEQLFSALEQNSLAFPWADHPWPSRCVALPNLMLSVNYSGKTDLASCALSLDQNTRLESDQQIPGEDWYLFQATFQITGYYLVAYAEVMSDPPLLRKDLPFIVGQGLISEERVEARTRKHRQDFALQWLVDEYYSESTTRELEINRLLGKVAGPWSVPNRSYPRPLPEELAPWYCYVEDQGHCILVILRQDYEPEIDPAEYLVPCPVKTVLRGYEIKDEWLVVVDLPYDETHGLLAPNDDYEY